MAYWFCSGAGFFALFSNETNASGTGTSVSSLLESEINNEGFT